MSTPEQFELPDLGEISSSAFRTFLLHHQLSYLKLAQAANVHVVSVYNVATGVPVLPEHEAAIRQGLRRLTGENYTAFIYKVTPR